MLSLLSHIKQGDTKALARAISFIENEVTGYEELLLGMDAPAGKKVIGITGAPGAGKSTLVDALIHLLVTDGKRVGILCVDPSSPFNLGALLGDRIRMSEWYTHPQVYIRSLASRGSVGGLNPKIIEITDLMKQAPFDHIIVETVGVGQTEIDIAGLADTTVVVVVPEGGDEVQTMKAGLMEIADVFVVNKGDRPGADQFVYNLQAMLAPAFYRKESEIAIVKTIASEGKGILELWDKISAHQALSQQGDRQSTLLAEKAWQLIQHKKMAGIDKEELKAALKKARPEEFNLYRFIKDWVAL
ncbi:MAG TPA: methylmalonyl Co-A mutase-associated GTPase MeaB [Chitinophagaceae bacterium]|nr:methylmalonyl Co-A mutase-associated GTPase MeaB [Chitinophagaceae bacterium]